MCSPLSSAVIGYWRRNLTDALASSFLFDRLPFRGFLLFPQTAGFRLVVRVGFIAVLGHGPMFPHLQGGIHSLRQIGEGGGDRAHAGRDQAAPRDRVIEMVRCARNRASKEIGAHGKAGHLTIAVDRLKILGWGLQCSVAVTGSLPALGPLIWKTWTRRFPVSAT